MSAVNLDGNLIALREYERRQDALEAHGEWVDSQVDDLMKDEDMRTEALMELYGDDPETLINYTSAILVNQPYKTKTQFGRDIERNPLSLIDDDVRGWLENYVREQDE